MILKKLQKRHFKSNVRYLKSIINVMKTEKDLVDLFKENSLSLKDLKSIKLKNQDIDSMSLNKLFNLSALQFNNKKKKEFLDYLEDYKSLCQQSFANDLSNDLNVAKCNFRMIWSDYLNKPYSFEDLKSTNITRINDDDKFDNPKSINIQNNKYLVFELKQFES